MGLLKAALFRDKYLVFSKFDPQMSWHTLLSCGSNLGKRKGLDRKMVACNSPAMVMKKRSFVLLELLLAIAILAITFVPLSGAPFFYFKKQRERLLNIELERQAELIFYDLVKDFKENHPNWNFTNNHKQGRFEVMQPVKIDIEGLGLTTYQVHYHLSQHSQTKDPSCYKLWCNICFETPQQRCKISHINSKSPYTFNFVVKRVPKKVDQKSNAMHCEDNSQK